MKLMRLKINYKINLSFKIISEKLNLKLHGSNMKLIY
jgi:hypothetical protein